ncbi:MltR family transcriptional regulator [Synechococcus sp. CCY9201]|uniref:MltR family transcriptional regulator n=1 Tax=Synechococcus sp. CCY9201 TaxID=174697 RepID=UPI002B1EBF84|nr:MltR family transcriptional regulator [Synechococcus sp. CCY9201]MEA5475374.1 MltR family transcriptional regulator [Synechococcus sp. CCY9201]
MRGLDYLDHESDRGVILIIGAMLDELLAELLKNVLEPSVADKLVNGSTAPLGSFSARAKISFAIGVVDAQDYKDIEVIRKVRNAAAHLDSRQGFNSGFKSQSIIGLCGNLSQNVLITSASAREKFIFAAKTTCGSIMSHVIIAQIVSMHKGHSAALKAVQGHTKGFMYNFDDIDEDD